MMRSIGFGILLFLCAACAVPTQPTTVDAGIRLVSPVDNETFTEGSLVAVRAQVNAPNGAEKFELLLDGSAVRLDELSNPLRRGVFFTTWRALGEGTHTLAVTSGGLSSNVVTILVTAPTQPTSVTEPLAQPTSITPEPTATFTPTPTITSTPVPQEATATANQDANCRFGDSTVFDEVGALIKGQSAVLLGNNAQGTWSKVRLSNGVECWIWNGALDIANNGTDTTVLPSPPTPTVVPVPQPLSPTGNISCVTSVALHWAPLSDEFNVSGYQWRLVEGANKVTGETSSDHVNVIVGCGKTYTWQVRMIGTDGSTGEYSPELTFKVKNP